VEVRSDRRWRFDADVATVWAAIAEVDEYRRWWPWLSRFDGAALAEGERWSCAVQPPLPYVLRFTVRLDAVEPLASVAATVEGDIVGTARIELVPDGDGASVVRLESLLAPANPFLRSVARFARPVVRFGHDWVLDTGARQFRRHAL
jgi:hypothetical protein